MEPKAAQTSVSFNLCRSILCSGETGGISMRVLLVEDEVRLAENLATALREGPGFAVDVANDGAAGDEMAGYRCYDLLVLDLMLPKLDGLALLRRVRARQDTT